MSESLRLEQLPNNGYTSRLRKHAPYAIEKTSEDIALGSENMSKVYNSGWPTHESGRLLACGKCSWLGRKSSMTILGFAPFFTFSALTMSWLTLGFMVLRHQQSCLLCPI